MTLYQNWQSFRSGFTDPVALGDASVDYEFIPDALTPRVVLSVSGDWDAAGFTDAMTAHVAGTSLNDGAHRVAAVVPGVLTFTAGTVLQAETALVAGVTIEGLVLDPADGMERWPVELVRANGFDGGISGIPTPYIAAGGGNILLTVNASAADAAFGVDEYDWYVSSRTETEADQYFNSTSIPTLYPFSFSGSMRLEQNVPTIAAGTGWDAVPGNLTPALNVKLFKYTDVYCRRRSDGAIQWINLLRAMQANA